MGRGCCYADTRKICTADVTKEIRSSFPGAAVFCTPRSCLFHFTHSTLFIFDFFLHVAWLAVFWLVVFMLKIHCCGGDVSPRGWGQNIYIYIYIWHKKNNDADQRLPHFNWPLLLNRAHLITRTAVNHGIIDPSDPCVKCSHKCSSSLK